MQVGRYCQVFMGHVVTRIGLLMLSLELRIQSQNRVYLGNFRISVVHLNLIEYFYFIVAPYLDA